MKIVEKPEGFELRDRRSTKSRDGKDWNPRDALYDADQAVGKMIGEGATVDALVIVYRVVAPDGTKCTRFRAAGEQDAVQTALLRAVGRYMSWENSEE